MRKIFIDCGSHDGCSLRKFRDLFDKNKEYEIYTFEANPKLQFYYDNLHEKHIHSNKAVWIKDAVNDFYISGFTGGSTLIKAKHNHNKNKRITRKTVCNLILPEEEKISIECIDLSVWIDNNFKTDDYIILKMDIEGAEYEILYKMFKDNTIKFINKLLIEFHHNKAGYNKKDDEKILKTLKEKNIEVDDKWDAMHKPYLIEKRCSEYNNEKLTQG